MIWILPHETRPVDSGHLIGKKGDALRQISGQLSGHPPDPMPDRPGLWPMWWPNPLYIAGHN
jgi:hypothetical protein